MELSYGGVARNVSECMSRLGVSPLLISVIGKDKTGNVMCDNLLECGLVRVTFWCVYGLPFGMRLGMGYLLEW